MGQDFNYEVVTKVETTKQYINDHLKNHPNDTKFTVPFYVPIRPDKLMDDFKKTVNVKLAEQGYRLGEFTNKVEILGYGVLRQINVTKI